MKKTISLLLLRSLLQDAQRYQKRSKLLFTKSLLN